MAGRTKRVVSLPTVHKYRGQGFDCGPIGAPDARKVNKIHGAKQRTLAKQRKTTKAQATWKERKLRADALNAEHNLQVRLDRMVDAEEVREAALIVARRVRTVLMTIPARISTMLSAEMDAKKVHAMLSKEIRGALMELSESL